MPADTWAHPPTIAPHGYGFSVPVAVTPVEVTDPDTSATSIRYDGIRIEVRSLASVDITAGIDADPDAGPEHYAEALALALDAVAPTIQGQIDEMADLVIGGL